MRMILRMTSALYQDELMSGKYVNIDIVLYQDPNQDSAHEAVFSRKHTKVGHPDIYFYNAKVKIPAGKPHFKYHIENLICKVQKVISIILKNVPFPLEKVAYYRLQIFYIVYDQPFHVFWNHSGCLPKAF